MSQIAEPITIRNVTFKNRIIKGAMSEALANRAGQPNDLHFGLYQAWAQGGLGCAITGNVMVDLRAKNEPGVVAIESERDLERLKNGRILGKIWHGAVDSIVTSRSSMSERPKSGNSCSLCCAI